MNNIRSILLWLTIGLVLFMAFNSFNENLSSSSVKNVSYSQFIADVRAGIVSEVEIQDRKITGTLVNNQKFTTHNPNDIGLVTELLDRGVNIISKPPESQSILLQIFISSFPILLLIALWVYFARNMGGLGGGSKGGGPFSFGKSKARMLDADKVKTRFKDVAGIDEAKDDLEEVVTFLKESKKFTDMGGNVPKGILLVGPPGTGKTLLAKAVAGEAGVPFFTISGSDFVEMFVGVGASRVRDMFEKAKKSAPCIIFVDEIDAVGRHRGSGMGGGHDEREQTLNQLLVEMDGFEKNDGVIIIAATNRPDVLDPALLRPGRFDRQIPVSLPDIRGREEILKVHMKKLPRQYKIDPMVIARGTPGFSGADLANLVNEAALIAVKQNVNRVEHRHFEQAKDKIMMGSERKSMVMDEKEKSLTAYHESGHAIVGLKLREYGHDPVYKVSIIPRGRALGVTMFLPEKDRFSLTRDQANAQISTLYGGRVAEEMIFGSGAVTTGASDDIKRASKLARKMVCEWGLSERLGPLKYGDDDHEVYIGHQIKTGSELSDETQKIIDQEVRKIIDTNYQRTQSILKENEEILHTMSAALMKYETIDEAQIQAILNGEPIPEPKGWTNLDEDEDSSDTKGLVIDETEVATKPKRKTSKAMPESAASGVQSVASKKESHKKQASDSFSA